MSRKLTREELRRDEVFETFEKGVHFFSQHRLETLRWGGVAVGAALLVAGVFGWRLRVERKASEHLSRALAILATPLASDPIAGTTPPVRTYPSAAARRADASTELKEAANRNSTASGRAAQVLLSGAGEAGSTAAGRLLGLAAAGNPALAAVAELDAARLMAANGKTADAIAELKRALAAGTAILPGDVILHELGALYEKSGSAADAKITYQRLIDEYPDSPYRADAQSRIGSL